MFMATIVIEKAVPVAGKKVRHNYPFDKMEVGDSFFVKLDTKGINVLRVLAHRYAKRNYCSFSTIKTDGGIRVWRVD